MSYPKLPMKSRVWNVCEENNHMTMTSFPAPSCGANSHYEMCAPTCQLTCSGPQAGCDGNALCTEGCVCDDGFLLSHDKCVSLAECGCQYRGQYYQNGQVRRCKMAPPRTPLLLPRPPSSCGRVSSFLRCSIHESHVTPGVCVQKVGKYSVIRNSAVQPMRCVS